MSFFSNCTGSLDDDIVVSNETEDKDNITQVGKSIYYIDSESIRFEHFIGYTSSVCYSCSRGEIGGIKHGYISRYCKEYHVGVPKYYVDGLTEGEKYYIVDSNGDITYFTTKACSVSGVTCSISYDKDNYSMNYLFRFPSEMKPTVGVDVGYDNTYNTYYEGWTKGQNSITEYEIKIDVGYASKNTDYWGIFGSYVYFRDLVTAGKATDNDKENYTAMKKIAKKAHNDVRYSYCSRAWIVDENDEIYFINYYNPEDLGDF